jgi:hypothetical protein
MGEGVMKKCECVCEGVEKDRECSFELTRFRNAELRHFVPCLTLTLALFQYPERTKVATVQILFVTPEEKDVLSNSKPLSLLTRGE